MRDRADSMLFEASHGQTILHVIQESCKIQATLWHDMHVTAPPHTAATALWECQYAQEHIAEIPQTACRELAHIERLDGVIHHIESNDPYDICHTPLLVINRLPLGLLVDDCCAYVAMIGTDVHQAEEYGVWFRQQALHYARHRIRINTILQSPNVSHTDLTAFLLGRHSRYLTGAVFGADGRQIFGSHPLAERTLVQSLFSMSQ